jgi:hypothetical protein
MKHNKIKKEDDFNMDADIKGKGIILSIIGVLVIATVIAWFQKPGKISLNTSFAQNVSLDLSPASSAITVNNTFNVNILLDTAGNLADGVDIYSLHFNPAVLQVVDANTSVAGVQISPGTLMPNTVINTVNNLTGVIQFSQATSGGTSFNGAGTLASINFRGVGAGTSDVTFDFILGNTADTNVGYQGLDKLQSVTNGTYSVDGAAPTVSINAPTSNALVAGTVTIQAQAADDVGVVGVQFKVDGTNLSAEDTTAPYSISWNTLNYSDTTHTITAVARDAAGNSTTSSSVTVTVSNQATNTPAHIVLNPSSLQFSGTSGGSTPASQSVILSNTGQSALTGTATFDQSWCQVSPASVAVAASSSITLNISVSAPSNVGSFNCNATISGNADNSPQIVSVVYNVAASDDTTPPIVTISKPVNGTVLPRKGSVKINASASDASGISSIQIVVDTRIEKTCLGVTTCVYNLSVAKVIAGVHTIKAIAVDKANNIAETSITVTK